MTKNYMVQALGLVAGLVISVAAWSGILDDTDAVVVSRGGQGLTLGDVDVMVSDLDPSIRGGYMDSPERIERTLNGLLLARQVSAEARKAGIDQSDEFKRRMRLAAEAVLMKLQIEAHLDALPAPDFKQLAKERYLAGDSEKWRTPELRDVSHILISTEGRQDDAAKALAEEIRNRLEKGEDFGELARTYSDDNKTAQNSQSLLDSQFWRIEKLAKGKTEKSFEDAAWKLKDVGELSTPVKSRYGYHIIRLDGITPSVKRPFDEVESSIVNELEKKWREDQRLQYITSFQAEKLEADPELVASLRTRYKSETASSNDADMRTSGSR